MFFRKAGAKVWTVIATGVIKFESCLTEQVLRRGSLLTFDSAHIIFQNLATFLPWRLYKHSLVKQAQYLAASFTMPLICSTAIEPDGRVCRQHRSRKTHWWWPVPCSSTTLDLSQVTKLMPAHPGIIHLHPVHPVSSETKNQLLVRWMCIPTWAGSKNSMPQFHYDHEFPESEKL